MRELAIVDIQRPDPKLYFGSAEHGFMNWDTLIWRFAAERSYWVATADQQPHSMPVWGIWQDCAFRFSTSPESRKAKNLRHNPKACVHLANTEALFVMHCDAKEISSEMELKAFVDDYNPKYKWDFEVDQIRSGTFALTPYKAFAWAAGEGERFHNTATRWTLEVR